MEGTGGAPHTVPVRNPLEENRKFWQKQQPKFHHKVYWAFEYIPPAPGSSSKATIKNIFGKPLAPGLSIKTSRTRLVELFLGTQKSSGAALDGADGLEPPPPPPPVARGLGPAPM